MDETRACEIAERYIDDSQQHAGVEFAINDEAIKRVAWGISSTTL